MNMCAEQSATESNRYFTPAGSAKVRACMASIGQGDKTAANDFLKLLLQPKADGRLLQKPYAMPTAMRIAGNVFGDEVDEERVKETVQDVLVTMVVERPNMKGHFSGDSDSWTLFSRDFQVVVADKFRAIKTKIHDESEAIHHPFAQASVAKQVRPTPEEALFASQRKAAIEGAMQAQLTPSQRLVLRLRAEDETLEEIGVRLDKTSKERVRQIESKAERTIKAGDKAAGGTLRSYVDAEDMRRTGRPEDLFR